MSADNPIAPPPTPDPAPLSVSFSRDEANYFLHVVDFHRELIEKITKEVTPLDLPVIAAFLQSVMETQIPEARQAFDEQRIFFGTVYPVILHTNAEEHPEEAPADTVIIVIPTPRNGPALDTYAEPARVILANPSRRIN